MREPIENEYFNWLCAKVLDRSTRSYYDLLRILYSTEFIWVVPADSHRVADGIELRLDFSREMQSTRDDVWEAQPCSVLEVLIAFAKRVGFQTDDTIKHWFWIFMENLQLDQFRRVTGTDEQMINDIVDTFIWRTYDPHGYGGLFPITKTENDQRKIEIWYQWCEYVEDRGLI